MKSFVAIFALVAVVAADVSHILGPDADAQVVEQDSDVSPDQYRYSYKTSNDIQAQEIGVIKNPGQENEGISVTGQSSYKTPEGETINTEYIADENGYQPRGAHLPVGPPIPEYIERSIAYILAHPSKESVGGRP